MKYKTFDDICLYNEQVINNIVFNEECLTVLYYSYDNVVVQKQRVSSNLRFLSTVLIKLT